MAMTNDGPSTKDHNVGRLMILFQGECGGWSSDKDSVQDKT